MAPCTDFLDVFLGIHQRAALPDKRHEEAEPSAEEERMISLQGKILSAMKKATWDLDPTDTFLKKKNNHSCLLQQHFLVCMCVCWGVDIYSKVFLLLLFLKGFHYCNILMAKLLQLGL